MHGDIEPDTVSSATDIPACAGVMMKAEKMCLFYQMNNEYEETIMDICSFFLLIRL